MQRVALLNWENINQDYDLAKIIQTIILPWVVEWLKVTNWQVDLWYAFIEVTRTGNTFYILFQNTSVVNIDTTWNKKVWVYVTQSYIDDWSNNQVNWSWIASIQTWANYPSNNYIPLASITNSIITDERSFVKYKWKGVTWSILLSKSSDIASASTVDLSQANGNLVHITWNTNISSFWIVQAWSEFCLIFDSILNIVHNSSILVLPWLNNITTASWDIMYLVSEWSWNWRCTWYQKKDWTSLYSWVVSVDFSIWDWSDWNITISTNTTLTRDMYYNNLTINTWIVLDPAWYTIYVKWVFTNNWIIRRNWNIWTVWGNVTTWWNTAWAWATTLNQWKLNWCVAWANWWEWATWGWSASIWSSWSNYNYTYLQSFWANWWAGTWWIPWWAWIWGSSWLMQIYDNQNTLITVFQGLTCSILPIMISWWAGWWWWNRSTASWWVWYKWPWWWGGWWSWWPIVIFCSQLLGSSWTIESKWGNWWNWWVNSTYWEYWWWWGWGSWWVVVIWCKDKNYLNKWTINVSWWTWWYSNTTKTWVDWQSWKIVLINS